MENKIKIVSISDIHNGGRRQGDTFTADTEIYTSAARDLTSGDILIIAGDITFARPDDYSKQIQEFEAFLDLLLEQSHKGKEIVLTFGNHDVVFDYNHIDSIRESSGGIENKIEIARDLYEGVGNKEKEFNKESKKAVLYMGNGMKIHELKDSGLNVLCSPYSKKIQFGDPGGFHGEDLTQEFFVAYERMVDRGDFDIVVTHESPFGYGDETERGVNVGTEILLNIFKKANKKTELWVSGHIHEDSGIKQGRGYGEGTTFINASISDIDYYPTNDEKIYMMDKKGEE